MKKLLLILIPVLFSGCEKVEFISEPSVAGEWTFVDYDIIIISSPSDVSIVKTDTICINSFSQQKVIGDNIQAKQDYNNTSKDRRFIVNKTTWNFDGPSQSTSFPLVIDKDINYDSWGNFPRPYFEKEFTSLVVKNMRSGDVTNYTFDASGMAQNYSKKLTLLSPVISTDILYGQHKREKALNVRILLRFMR
jgi:hypothetical protein